MKKEVKNENEVLSFEDLHKRMSNLRGAVEDAKAQKENVLKGIEKCRDEIILIDRSICEAQDKLNSELVKDGKASSKTLDAIAVLRHKHEDLESAIISLKTGTLPGIDEVIRLAQKEQGLAYELAMDQLRPMFATLITTQFSKIEQIAEEWANESSRADNLYGQTFWSIDRRRIKGLKGYKRDTILLDRISSF
jgi:hypothetical protein